MRPGFDQINIPDYHNGLLFVQARPNQLTPSSLAAMSFSPAADPSYGAPWSAGLSALSYFERAGLIKRVVPVTSGSRESAQTPFATAGLGVAATIMANAAADAANPTPSGLSLIELERDEDCGKLQLALANDPTIASVSRVPIRYLSASKPSKTAAAAPAATPPQASLMWNLRKIQWAEARQTPGFVDSDAIDIAVLDSGFDAGHPDLAGRLRSYVYDHPALPNASSPQDLIGHGTHVAGTIAAVINNNLGINGICSSKINAWKIFSDVPTLWQNAFVYFVDPVMYIKALTDCIDRRPAVVNLSIGGPGAPSAPEAEAFRTLIANNTIVVAAMGNGRQQGSVTSYPAAIPGVIAVGATGLDDRIANFSNRGNHITLCAPGEAVWSTLPTYPGQSGFDVAFGSDGRPRQGQPHRRELNYDAWPGTSMATPHVTAAIALYFSNGGERSLNAVRDALKRTVDKTANMGGADFHPDFGFGRLNLDALIKDARTSA